MNSTKAKEIIESLANGIDYESGEVLPSDSILNRGEVVRALHACLGGLELLAKKEITKSKLPPNAGKSWSDDEDLELATEFKGGLNAQEIGIRHARSTGSITSRLVRLGLITGKPVKPNSI